MSKFKHKEIVHEENPKQKLLDKFIKKLKKNKKVKREVKPLSCSIIGTQISSNVVKKGHIM